MRLILLAALSAAFFWKSCNRVRVVEAAKGAGTTACPSVSEAEKDAVLTSGILKIEEIRFLQDNTQYYYKRGGQNNTINFDTEYIKFNTYHTGEYVAGGITYTLTWKWMDGAKTKLRYVVSYDPALTVTWEQLQFTGNSIAYAEYYNRTGNESMGYAIRRHY